MKTWKIVLAIVTTLVVLAGIGLGIYFGLFYNHHNLGDTLTRDVYLVGYINDPNYKGDYLQSPNGKYRFKNISGVGILYDTDTGNPVYQTESPPATESTRIYLQGDGNFVNRSSEGVWGAHTQKIGVTKMVLTNDGQLQAQKSDGTVVWVNGQRV